MKKVYRFAHKDPNVGLWDMKNGEKSNWIEKLNLSNKEMPMGRNDDHYIAPRGHTYHCSAPDMKTLLFWFSEKDYPILKENDFVLYEYTVTEYKEDGPQTLFTMEGVIEKTLIPYENWLKIN